MQRYMLILIMLFGAATAEVYSGQGQMHYSHMFDYFKSGLRMVYRPESYRTYSPVGLAWHCYFKGVIYLSDYYLNKKYYTDIIATDDRTLLDWDNVGKYYFYEDYRINLQQEYLIGYAIYIYDDDNALIYYDTNHHYAVPNEIDYCALDHEAASDENKCFEILDEGSYSGNVYSNAEKYDEGIFRNLSAATEVLYSGHGQMHYVYGPAFSLTRFRMVYKPESYETYSPVGLAWRCYFKYATYLSDHYLNKRYYTDIIATYPDDWTLLDWDNVGKYYYYEDRYIELQQEYLIGYAIYIFDDDQILIYNDTYHPYTVPYGIDSCELDHQAESYEKKCSEIFDVSGYSGNEYSNSGSNNEGSSTTANAGFDGRPSYGNEYSNFGGNNEKSSNKVTAGTTAAIIIILIILLSMAIGVVVCIKKRRATTARTLFQRRPNTGTLNNSDSPNRGVQINQLQQPNIMAPAGQVNSASNPPPYQMIDPSPVVFQPPPPAVACLPAPFQPSSYRSAVLRPASILSATVQPTVVQQAIVPVQPSAPPEPSLTSE